MRLPAHQGVLCRYGAPFRAGTNPVSRYFAGVGSAAGATDIVPFQEVARPCVPCLRPCDRFQCEPSCPRGAVPLPVTLTNLSLPRLVALVDDNVTVQYAPVAGNDENTDESLPFFLTVKSVLGNGKWAMASSNGFYLDDTPPSLDVFFYLDANINEYQPVEYQSSDSVISALWGFLDDESLVKENFWAIGTSRGATDLQGFVSVGSNQTAANRNLTGRLLHNHTYYITLKALNGAGLETVVECDGVTVLLERPSSEDVNTTALFSQRFEEEVYPPEVERSEGPDQTGTSWTRAEDESITQYEYCVGSTLGEADIVPCIVVGVNASGSVAIQDGLLVIRAGDQEERYNVSDFGTQLAASSESTVAQGPSRFHMEPGKTLHSWMRMCNAAMLCSVVSAGTTMVIGADDTMVTSNGTDITLTPVSIQRRRRRSTDDQFDLTVTTHGGLHNGGSLVLGLLDDQKLEEEFTSDAFANYQSYIVNPRDTIQYTSRLLRERITYVYKPLFYLTSLGQTELQGPLGVTVHFHTPANWTQAKPGLIFWNTDQSEWQNAASTCSEAGDQIVYEEDRDQVTIQVCGTQGLPNTTYFSRETEFAVCIILDAIPNSPPVIINHIQEMYIDEDQGTLVYTFQASDTEDDEVVFELGPVQDLLGTASITDDGKFSFTPCPDCHGWTSVQIIVREVATLAQIQPLSATDTVLINVRPVNDNPVLFMARAGQTVGNGRTAVVTVEQNIETNVAYEDLLVTLGAYDVDRDDSPRIRYHLPSHGDLTLSPASREVPAAQSCGVPSVDESLVRIPCGLEIPHDQGELSWAVSTLTYTPHPGFYGSDSFLLLAEDDAGSMSQLLQVQVYVLANPCTNNGTCLGPAEDPNCISTERSLGFESYSCRCPPGWTGDGCKGDIDECLSDPCALPYVCRNLLDGYRCGCPESNPGCDDILPQRLINILAGCCSALVLLIIILAGFICWKQQSKKKTCKPDFSSTNMHPMNQPSDTSQSAPAFDNPADEDTVDPGQPTTTQGFVDAGDVDLTDVAESVISPCKPEPSCASFQPTAQPSQQSVQAFDNPAYEVDVCDPHQPMNDTQDDSNMDETVM